MVCFCVIEDLKASQNYPVLLQAFFDLCLGYFSLLHGSIKGIMISRAHKPGYHLLDAHTVTCVSHFGSNHISKWTTPLTMTTIAVTRYIIVCHPIFSKTLNFHKLQKYANIIITAASWGLILCNACYVGFHFEPYRTLDFEICEMSFYADERQKALIEGTVLFLVPVTACLVLYTFVGVRLWKMTSMQSRNRQLSVLFLCSCVVWIIFWAPPVVFKLSISHSETPLTTRNIFFSEFCATIKNCNRIVSSNIKFF